MDLNAASVSSCVDFIVGGHSHCVGSAVGLIVGFIINFILEGGAQVPLFIPIFASYSYPGVPLNSTLLSPNCYARKPQSLYLRLHQAQQQPF